MFNPAANDSLFASMAVLLNRRFGERPVTSRSLRAQTAERMTEQTSANAEYTAQLTKAVCKCARSDAFTHVCHSTCLGTYLQALQISPDDTSIIRPIEGDYPALQTICQRFRLSICVLSSIEERIIAGAYFATATAAPPSYLLLEHNTSNLSSNRYVPLEYHHHPDAVPLASIPYNPTMPQPPPNYKAHVQPTTQTIPTTPHPPPSSQPLHRLSADQTLAQYGLQQIRPFRFVGGDCLFASMAMLLPQPANAPRLTAISLRAINADHMRERTQADPVYRDEVTAAVCTCVQPANTEDQHECRGRCLATYLDTICNSFETVHLNRNANPPIEGDYPSLANLCHRFQVTVEIISSVLRRIIMTAAFAAPDSTDVSYILYDPPANTGVMGHYMPLELRPGQTLRPISTFPRTTTELGTELHIQWIPNTAGRLNVTPAMIELFGQPWVCDRTLPIPTAPPTHRLAFSVHGSVQYWLVHHGELEVDVLRLAFQIFSQRLQRNAHALPPNHPRTLALDTRVISRLFEDTRNAVASTPTSPAIMATAAGVYNFEHAWHYLLESTRTYPHQRPTAMTAAEILSHHHILIPKASSRHFILVHINLIDRTVRLLDSLVHTTMPIRARLVQHIPLFMRDLERFAQPTVLRPDFVVLPSPHLPQQNDAESCGMFSIAYAAQIFANHLSCDILTQDHILDLRMILLKMFAEEPPPPIHRRH